MYSITEVIRKTIRKFNFKGKGRLANFLFPSPFRGVIKYKRNQLIEINTEELICWNVYWYGGYEDEVTWLVDILVHEDDVVLDFGANIGIWTLLFSEKAKTVHSIEPHPEFRRRLISNLNINRITNVNIYGCAVSINEGATTLFAPPSEMKNKSASILDLNSELSEKIEVQVRSMDSLFSGLDKVDFIKIDCDGSDAEIILSGKKTISTHKPIIIFEDLGGYNTSMGDKSLIDSVDKAYNEVFQFLEAENYRFFNVLNGTLKETKRITGSYSNIIAIPRSAINSV